MLGNRNKTGDYGERPCSFTSLKVWENVGMSLQNRLNRFSTTQNLAYSNFCDSSAVVQVRGAWWGWLMKIRSFGSFGKCDTMGYFLSLVNSWFFGFVSPFSSRSFLWWAFLKRLQQTRMSAGGFACLYAWKDLSVRGRFVKVVIKRVKVWACLSVSLVFRLREGCCVKRKTVHPFNEGRCKVAARF